MKKHPPVPDDPPCLVPRREPAAPTGPGVNCHGFDRTGRPETLDFCRGHPARHFKPKARHGQGLITAAIGQKVSVN